MTKKERIKILDQATDVMMTEFPGLELYDKGYGHQDENRCYRFFVKDACWLLFEIWINAKHECIGADVGWSAKKDFKSATYDKTKKGNLGTLEILKKLECPHEFQYDEFILLLGRLKKLGSSGSYDISGSDKISVINNLVSDIKTYGLPYLDMMLNKRFNVSLSDVLPSYKSK